MLSNRLRIVKHCRNITTFVIKCSSQGKGSKNMKPPRMKVFKERFNKLRGEKSQEEFAEFLGISRPTVGFYENGSRLPDALTLSQIARKCNVSADWLLGLSDTRQYSGTLSDACNYTGLSEDIIAFFHERSSSAAFTAENTINNLNAFLTPSNLVWVSLALNSFAREIQASRFDKFIDKTIEQVLSEYTEYLESENIDTSLLSIQINREILDFFADQGNISQNMRVAIQQHLLHTLALPTIVGFLEKDTANIDRYAVSRTLENTLDNFTKYVEENAQFPADRTRLENIIKIIYTHKQKYNELPKKAPTPDGLPF